MRGLHCFSPRGLKRVRVVANLPNPGARFQPPMIRFAGGWKGAAGGGVRCWNTLYFHCKILMLAVCYFMNLFVVCCKSIVCSL